MKHTVFSMAILLFLMANPIGGVPLYVSLVKDFEFRRQRWILFREAVFSAILAYFFLFVGEQFLAAIQIEPYAVNLSAGILILLVALSMIFPSQESQKGSQSELREPFFVPIATPLISGGGVFATIIFLAKQSSVFQVSLSIAVAWSAVIAIVVSSVYLQKILGKRGLIVLERLMGMILLMTAAGLLTSGLNLFLDHVNKLQSVKTVSQAK